MCAVRCIDNGGGYFRKCNIGYYRGHHRVSYISAMLSVESLHIDNAICDSPFDGLFSSLIANVKAMLPHL